MHFGLPAVNGLIIGIIAIVVGLIILVFRKSSIILSAAY